MKKMILVSLALCAFFVPAAVLAGCGGVPGNAVADVDGESIEKTAFDHWMGVLAKDSGQKPAAKPPKPPDYKACVADKRKTAPKPAKGQPKVTDAALKTQCKKDYEALRTTTLQVLIAAEWITREADDMGLKVSDAEFKKSFDQQKKQAFPKAADYAKFLKTSGQTQADIDMQVRQDLLRKKIIAKVTKGTDKVPDAQIKQFYDKNKARFAQPERRDLRIVLTKTKAKADQAKRALDGGESFSKVAKRLSIDQASKSQGGKLPGVAKGQQEKALDDAIFKAAKGKLVGPIKTQFGYYVLEVTKITPQSQQTLEQAKATIKQTVASENYNKKLERFAKAYQKRWRAKTECREGFKTPECKNGPKPTPTPTPAPGQVPGQAPAG
jgi:foldase protein PrsA